MKKPMGSLAEGMQRDHERIDELLVRSVAGAAIDMESYEQFRGALLRHIGIEEKILLPAARRARGGEPLPVAGQLRADHAALAALVVPSPTRALVAEIEHLLAAHNQLEEGPDGMYAACEALLAAELDDLLRRLDAAPAVPLAPHFDGPRAFAGIDRLLRAAGRR
jgi:hypothetical protein